MKDLIENTLSEIEKTGVNLSPKHIGNGIYIVNGIMCNEKFIEEVNNAILEDVKDKRRQREKK